MLFFLKVFGRIKAITLLYVAEWLKNFTAKELTFPNGGFPIVKIFISLLSIEKLKKSFFKIESWSGSISIEITLECKFCNCKEKDPFPALGSTIISKSLKDDILSKDLMHFKDIS